MRYFTFILLAGIATVSAQAPDAADVAVLRYQLIEVSKQLLIATSQGGVCNDNLTRTQDALRQLSIAQQCSDLEKLMREVDNPGDTSIFDCKSFGFIPKKANIPTGVTKP